MLFIYYLPGISLHQNERGLRGTRFLVFSEGLQEKFWVDQEYPWDEGVILTY